MSPIYQSEKVSLKISFLITLWLAANKLNNCFIVDVFVLKFFKEQKKNLKVMSLFVGVRFGQKTFFFGQTEYYENQPLRRYNHFWYMWTYFCLF